MSSRFGRYRLDGLIARGGMGEVYRAYDTEHDRVVAVKLLASHLAADDDFRGRFVREARAAARLRDPHVIPIHAYGEIDGRLYLDMRLVDGEDLSSTLTAGGPLRPDTALDVLGQVAAALDAAHADGLVHRDVKPSNVLIGPGGFAYLADFGIARSLTSNADITGTGSPIGTVAYMAPERFEPGPIDHRVDVYALACLFFQCLTGVPPFTGHNPLALMHAHLTEEPPRPTAHRPDLPPSVDHVIATGMAKDPAQRFASAGALAAAARDAFARPELPTSPRPATTPAPAHRRPSEPRRGRLAAAIGLGVVVLAGAAALVLLPALRDRTPPADDPAVTTTAPSGTGPDLAVDVPLTTPDCDGRYLVIVGAAVAPPRYAKDVQAILDEHPGAAYLHAPSTGCASIRHQRDGADIYSVYFGPFADRAAACERRAEIGADAYVRVLDDTSTPDAGVPCG